jgi:succinoglycan biosynthesis transport protein ExoP
VDTQDKTQILSISHNGKQLQEVPTGETEELNAPPSKGFNLRPLLRTVRRKALLIIGITGLVGVGAWYSGSTVPSSYQGSFRVLVEPVTTEAKITEPTALAIADGKVPDAKAFGLDYATQIEILKSPKMLSAIVEQVKSRYPHFSRAELENGLVVQRSGSDKTQLPDQKVKIIDVFYQGEDAKKVQFVLETTSDTYLKYSLDERKKRIGEGVEFIEDQLPGLKQRVDTLRTQLQQMQQQYQITDPQGDAQAFVTQLRQVTAQQLDTQKQLQEQRKLYNNLQKELNLSPSEALAASALSEDPTYRDLLAKVKEVENQIAVESVRFLPDSPNIQALQVKRQSLVSLANQEVNRLLGRNLAGVTRNPQVLGFQNSVRLALIKQLLDTTNQLQILEVSNQALGNNKAVLEQQVQRFPAVARKYVDLQRQVEIANRTFDQLLSQRESLRVQAAQKQVPWELVAQPKLPKDANGKPKAAAANSKTTMMLGVAGLLLGIGVAALIEKYRNIFYSSDDIKDAIPLPILGEIPRTKEGDPRFYKAFDSLYTNIRFLFSDRPIGSLAICSSEPSDGKSMIALNLAQTAAGMGQRVLLVDANLRFPQIHSQLNLPNQKGLSDLLIHKLPPNDLIVRSPGVDNLFVLTAGSPSPDATRLLGSAQMQYLMETFQATFDLVVYDTPHLFDLLDANFIATNTDGLLLVVGVHKTKQSIANKVLEQINTYRLPSLGVVVNYVKPR